MKIHKMNNLNVVNCLGMWNVLLTHTHTHTHMIIY